jgi:serine/threonine protein kinase
MTSTIEQFRHALLYTGLLSEDELNSLLEELPLEERPLTSEALGEFLVNKQKLTPYQVEQILEEKGDGLLLGKYIIQDVIRRGAMGVVYRARHAQMKRDVALKVILSNLADDPECVARFHREVHLAARLDHPNIVTAFDASEENGQLFLVMEYIEGEDLKTIINKRGSVSIDVALDYIIQAARGLKYAHGRGVIHRDVKPSNLLLSKSGTIKLLDVGLAMEECDRNDSDLTSAGGLLGSVNYMAPEQARDARNADARSDIYSLGCTLWYLLAGSFIYEEKTVVNRILAHRDRPVPDLESLGENIPAELQSIFQKMVAKHPDDRYQSMAELLEDLEILRFQLSEPDTESSVAACETDHGWSLHDTDHIRLSSDRHLIDLQDDPPEEYSPDDPTQFSQEMVPTGRLQAALIIIGGFALGCLVVLGFQFLEPRGLHGYQDLKTSAFHWFDEETGPEIDALPEPPVPGGTPDQSNDSGSASTDVSKSNSSETDGVVDGRPVLAAVPFSPEEARAHQQRWADSLGTEVEQTNSLGIKMILIPPGTYEMGSNPEDHNKLFNMFPDKLTKISEQFDHEFPQHSVTLTRPYYISAYVVTFAQFQQFVNESGYQVQPATLERWKELRSRKATPEINDLPIRHICWNDAAAFCQWLSETEERLYRLPTDAEWEYAARAGSQELFGHDRDLVYAQEWWRENADGPKPIGLRQANAFGLYDMCGNVREYCQDFYSRFSAQAQTDPLVDTPRADDERVVRGGDATSSLYEIRPGRRSNGPASDKVVNDISFRIVSPVVIPEKRDLHIKNLLSYLLNAE